MKLPFDCPLRAGEVPVLDIGATMGAFDFATRHLDLAMGAGGRGKVPFDGPTRPFDPALESIEWQERECERARREGAGWTFYKDAAPTALRISQRDCILQPGVADGIGYAG